MDFLVGTFNLPYIYTLHFDPTKDSQPLTISKVHAAIGGHSWLSLSADQSVLYCTAWTKPKPSIATYRIKQGGKVIEFLNSKPVQGQPGYVCCSGTHVYSVGAATGEVFAIDPSNGGLGEQVQTINFVENAGEQNMSEKRGEVVHGDFGGLRHGAHSCDLSPDGRTLYVADIGRNCVWTFDVATPQARRDAGTTTMSNLSVQRKHTAPRSYDGPRHVWPHPNNDIVYSLQEHSSMVDAFKVVRDATGAVTDLIHCGGGNILPSGRDRTAYWADEVRLSTGPDSRQPKYLYASTRGLQSETMGYVAVFELAQDGTFAKEEPLDIWETPTSGGIANAIEPAPWQIDGSIGKEIQYLALTDSDQGKIMVLSFDGDKIRERAQITLPLPEAFVPDSEAATTSGRRSDMVEAATAVWLRPRS